MRKNRLIFVSLGLGLTINIILWLMFAGKFGFQSQRIPLHFNVVYGVDFLGSSRQVYEIPLAGLFILFMNLFLIRLLPNTDKFVIYTLSFGAMFVQILLLIAGIALVRLNV